MDDYFAKQLIEKIKSANEKEKYKYLEVKTPIATRDRYINHLVRTINIYLDSTKNDLTDRDCFNQLMKLKNTLINDNIGSFSVYIIIDNTTFFCLKFIDYDTYTVCRFYSTTPYYASDIETYEKFLEVLHHEKIERFGSIFSFYSL